MYRKLSQPASQQRAICMQAGRQHGRYAQSERGCDTVRYTATTSLPASHLDSSQRGIEQLPCLWIRVRPRHSSHRCILPASQPASQPVIHPASHECLFHFPFRRGCDRYYRLSRYSLSRGFGQSKNKALGRRVLSALDNRHQHTTRPSWQARSE